MTSLTVVLPCAGGGTRLGLPFPKELLPDGHGRVLIDHTFALLTGHDVQVLLVAGPARQATIAHLTGHYPQVPVAVVAQRAAATGWIGAVREALPFAGDRVLVLLPDQLLQATPVNDPIGQAATALLTTDACLLAAWCNDPDRLGDDGALTVEKDRGNGPGLLRGLADKPGRARAAQHNAVWFGIGFRRSAADQVLAQMRAAEQQPLDATALQGAPLDAAPVVEVPAFVDCGTWPRVRDLWCGSTKGVPGCG